MTDAPQVVFTVAGVPAPQGSKTRTKYGMREDNPKTRPWREAISWHATEARTETFDGPLELVAYFYFPRPKSHFRTGRFSGCLKESAPTHCVSKPDTDKLVRACADAMSGILYRDDAQLVRITAHKLYGEPRAEIIIRPIY